MDERASRLVIYDLPEGDVKQVGNDIMFDAKPMVEMCGGCFGCWIKTPGRCVKRDRAADIPAYMAGFREVVIISPVVYGGYSPCVKAVIDRSIPYVLPYFRIVGGKMHHKLRHKNRFRLKVCFYGECSDGEKQIAKRLVEANAVNFGAAQSDVVFYENAESLKREVF